MALRIWWKGQSLINNLKIPPVKINNKRKIGEKKWNETHERGENRQERGQGRKKAQCIIDNIFWRATHHHLVLSFLSSFWISFNQEAFITFLLRCEWPGCPWLRGRGVTLGSFRRVIGGLTQAVVGLPPVDVLDHAHHVLHAGPLVRHHRNTRHGYLQELNHLLLDVVIPHELRVEDLRGPLFAHHRLDPPREVYALFPKRRLVRGFPR